MLRACITGIACLAFLSGGFWVLEYGTRRRRGKVCFNISVAISNPREKKVLPVVTHHKHDIDVDTYVEEREDRISQLPDDVISLIVSQLDTIDAVRTSVLSRRWKHVYTFISEVRFCCCYGMSPHSNPCSKLKGEKLSEFQRKFVRAVDTFLQHHSGSRITYFELVCCFRGRILDSCRRWVNYVGRLGVERLTILSRCPNRVLKSNPPVFSSDFLPETSSVKRIYLVGGSFQILSQKSLKDLELTDVTFTSEAVECLLLNCCCLQSLKLKYCVLPSKLHIQGPDLQLKNLVVFNCSKVAEIDLDALNLTNFELRTPRMLILSFSNVPLLQNLSVDCDHNVAPYVFGKVAKDLPHLKCMFFWTDARFFEAFEIGGVNKLSHLRQLGLLLVYKNNLDLLALATILDVCPLLHKFHLSMRLPSTFSGKLAEKKRAVRHHTQLKEVEFSGFSGTENEYDFILCILENVVSLERLSIILDVRYYHLSLGCWLSSDHNRNRRGDKEKRRLIREWLQGQTISENVEISIV